MNEEQLKQAAYEQQAKYGTVGGATQECAMPARDSLTQGFRAQASRLRRDQHKLDQLNELTYLLDKNPEVARILDLIDAIGN